MHDHDHPDHDHDHDHEHHHHHHDPEQELLAFRAAKDEFWREDPQSPLPEEEHESFSGLRYFPYNPDLALVLPLDRDVSDEVVTVQTSTGDTREYRPVGRIRFDVDGEEAHLMVYDDGGEELFLPMRDATSGKESYGAGRYLEPQLVDDDLALVDFNYLYNPYCAYNELYSCPLPPRENWIQVPIRAGEKTYHAE